MTDETPPSAELREMKKRVDDFVALVTVIAEDLVEKRKHHSVFMEGVRR